MAHRIQQCVTTHVVVVEVVLALGSCVGVVEKVTRTSYVPLKITVTELLQMQKY